METLVTGETAADASPPSQLSSYSPSRSGRPVPTTATSELVAVTDRGSFRKQDLAQQWAKWVEKLQLPLVVTVRGEMATTACRGLESSQPKERPPYEYPTFPTANAQRAEASASPCRAQSRHVRNGGRASSPLP